MISSRPSYRFDDHRIGDTVRLRGASQIMTVTNIGKLETESDGIKTVTENNVTVVWFAADMTLQRTTIPIEALILDTACRTINKI